jgi:hypothetical protein
MSLFQNASRRHRKLKVLGYGPTGTGKTIFALTFPDPVVMDMERGTIHYEQREAVPGIGQSTDFRLLRTSSAIEVTQGLDELITDFDKWERGGSKGKPPCGTIIIDPFTIFWQQLQEAYVEKMKKGGANEFTTGITFRDWGSIKRPLKNLMVDLLNLPVHFVLTGHEGKEYKLEKNEITVIGTKPKVEADTPYAADIVLRFDAQDKGGGTNVFVEKDRTGVLGVGTSVKNLTFKAWSKYLAETEASGKPEAKQERDTAAKDSKLFSGAGNVDQAGGTPEEQSLAQKLAADPSVVKFLDEMDWPPAKRTAMAQKFTALEDFQKFVGEATRAFRDEKRRK